MKKKLTNKRVKRILRQVGAAHRQQAVVSEPKPTEADTEQQERLEPGLWLVDAEGNMRLVAVPGEQELPPALLAGSAPYAPPMPSAVELPPMPESPVVHPPALPDPQDCYPIPPALQYVRGSITLADATAEELLDELEMKLPAFLVACPASDSGYTRFRHHGRQSEVMGLFQLLIMWGQRNLYG